MHHLVEVVDELREVLNGVDVVVRRRGDQGHSRLAAPQVGDVGAHLLRRQLPALTCATEGIQGCQLLQPLQYVQHSWQSHAQDIP